MSFLDYISGREEYKSALEGGDNRSYGLSKSGQVEPIEESPLPAIGGLLGTVGGVALQRAPYIGPLVTLGTGGRNVGMFGGAVRTLAPSLIGSTIGTGTGLAIEGAVQDQRPTQNRVLGELVSNAAFDVGGNLIFGAAGKTFKVAQPYLSEFLPFLKDKTPEAAREAAQRFLSERGATLTRAQLSGSNVDIAIEEVARGGTGAAAFREQEKNVKRAIQEGVDEFKTKLSVSEPFKQALRSGDPAQMALGDNFKEAINVARDEFKSVHRPFYEKLTQDTGAYVDMRPIKAQAQQEYNRLAQGKFAGAGADKKTILEDILKQDDFVDFGVAHDIRSNFGASARDKVDVGGKATTLSAGYSRYENEISKAMDDSFALVGSTRQRVEGAGYKFTPSAAESPNAMVTGQTGFNPYLKRTEETKSLLNQYKNTQAAIKEGMDGLYNNTLTQAMVAEPEQVGKFLFNPESPSRMRDVFKAVAQVDKYKKADVINGLKYGFIEQAMSSPENVLKLSQTIEKDKAFSQGFDYLFKGPGEKKALQDILGAAKFGLDEGTASQIIRNRTVLEGTRFAAQAGTLGGGFLLLPTDVQDKIQNNLPEIIATTGVLLFTPRLISKAMTSKAGQDALIDLGKVQANPKLAGALSAKIARNLTESGIIDNEYITDINNRLKGQATQPNQPTPVTAPQPGSFIDFLKD